MNEHYSQQIPKGIEAADISVDIFDSPQSSRCHSYQQTQSSLDVFAETPKRRSTGESNSLARAIRDALDPEYDYPNYSHEKPRCSFYDDEDASILAAVSSNHSSQEVVADSRNRLYQKHQKPHEVFPVKNSRTLNFGTGSQTSLDDFLSPDKIEKYRNRPRRPQVKQIRMDDYLFKARRVDKGSRVFGLHTTHEPKRGSKKKRESIELLEVEDAEIQRKEEKKTSSIAKSERNAEVENLDFSLAFGTPSPSKKNSRNTKLTKFFGRKNSAVAGPSSHTTSKPSISFNDPKKYCNDSVLDNTLCNTSNDSILIETMPISTPTKSPKASENRHVLPSLNNRNNTIVQKRKPDGFDLKEESLHPVTQHKRKKVINNPKKPEFDYPSSPITLADNDDAEMNRLPRQRETLKREELERKKFESQITERENMMRQLVDRKFKTERENGGIEQRRAELKDGQVIRNKEMRKNLMHGAACKCCRGYYKGLGMSEQEQKDHMNKISRHRYVHQALPDTPERYWDLTLGSSDNDEGVGLNTQQRNWETTATTKKSSSDGVKIQNWN